MLKKIVPLIFLLMCLNAMAEDVKGENIEQVAQEIIDNLRAKNAKYFGPFENDDEQRKIILDYLWGDNRLDYNTGRPTKSILGLVEGFSEVAIAHEKFECPSCIDGYGYWIYYYDPTKVTLDVAPWLSCEQLPYPTYVSTLYFKKKNGSVIIGDFNAESDYMGGIDCGDGLP